MSNNLTCSHGLRIGTMHAHDTTARVTTRPYKKIPGTHYYEFSENKTVIIKFEVLDKHDKY